MRLNVLLAALLAAGCGTVKLPDYPSHTPTSSKTLVNTQSGLEISVDPFFDDSRSQQFFGMDALKQDLIVLHVRIQNLSRDRTYLVQKRDFSYIAGGGAEQKAGETIHHSSAGGEALALSGAALFSLPLLFIGGKMVADAQAVRLNLVKKELRDQTLAPGQTMGGFIYYQLPKQSKAAREGVLTIRTSPTAGGAPVATSFKFTHEN